MTPPASGLRLPALPWVSRAPGMPYFQTEDGRAWTPVGQNDAVTWPELAGLFRRRDVPAVERHLHWLAAHGVTCLRLMLEYCQTDHRYFERPAGVFNPAMVALWDDLFTLCGRAGLRVLLTPLDTFFTWIRWRHHPYNRANGGPCRLRTQLMVHPGVRDLVKQRLAFATGRWGGSGVIFAWDLWNEMHPAQADNRLGAFAEYIEDVGPYLRDLETRLHGRAHLQTVSVFGPELGWKPWLNEPVFRHPSLDFANSHFYEEGTIDDPHDTIAPALAAGRLTGEALAEIADQRPFFDSEHGPIHTFKDHHKTLPAAFDDEYFRHIQWAHLASGGAGGGMRWPNRKPHTLTPGMRQAQRAMAGFLELVDWTGFDRRNISAGLHGSEPGVAALGCGDAGQAVVWLLRTGPRNRGGRADQAVRPGLALTIPGLQEGAGNAVFWDTGAGCRRGTAPVLRTHGLARVDVPAFGADLALAVRIGG